MSLSPDDDDDDAELFRPPPVTAKSQLRFLWGVALVAALLGIAQLVLSAGLVSDAAPWGIVSFELAGTKDATEAMLASWDDYQRGQAAYGLTLDYAFLLLYGLFFWTAGRRLATRWQDAGRPDLASLFRRLAGIGWLAALLDAVENAVLGVFVAEAAVPDPSWPRFAAAVAGMKFALVALLLVAYIAAWGRLRTAAPEPGDRTPQS